MGLVFIVGINSKSFPWPVHSTPEHTPEGFAVDDQMQITTLRDTFVITRRRHELYTYSIRELLFHLQLQTVSAQKITFITGHL